MPSPVGEPKPGLQEHSCLDAPASPLGTSAVTNHTEQPPSADGCSLCCAFQRCVSLMLLAAHSVCHGYSTGNSPAAAAPLLHYVCVLDAPLQASTMPTTAGMASGHSIERSVRYLQHQKYKKRTCACWALINRVTVLLLLGSNRTGVSKPAGDAAIAGEAG